MPGVFFHFDFIYKNLCIKANSADPDQTLHSAASDLGLNCLPMSQNWDTGHKRVKDRKIQTPKTVAVFVPKFEQCGFGIEECIQKMQIEWNGKQFAQWNCSLIWVYTFCEDVSVQTLRIIMVLGEKQSDQGLICTFWTHYAMVEPPCSNFRVITANFSDVQNFSDVTIILLALCEFHQSFQVLLIQYIRGQRAIFMVI